MVAPLWGVGCGILGRQWRRYRPQLHRRPSQELRAHPHGGDCGGGLWVDRTGTPRTRGRRSGAHVPRPPVPAHHSPKQTPYANPPQFFSTTTRMAWLVASPPRPRSTSQVQEDPDRARLLRHGSGRSAASFGALKELHAPRTSDLQCDLMCEACVALSDGEGLHARPLLPGQPLPQGVAALGLALPVLQQS